MHPCFKKAIGTPNCGHCKKCIRDMVLFYAWGMQKEFEQLYDWCDFEQKLPFNLAVLLSLSDEPLCHDVLAEYTRCGKKIPAISYSYAKHFREAKQKNKWFDACLKISTIRKKIQAQPLDIQKSTPMKSPPADPRKTEDL